MPIIKPIYFFVQQNLLQRILLCAGGLFLFRYFLFHRYICIKILHSCKAVYHHKKFVFCSSIKKEALSSLLTAVVPPYFIVEFVAVKMQISKLPMREKVQR